MTIIITLFWFTAMALFCYLLSKYIESEEVAHRIEKRFKNVYNSVNSLHLFTGEKTSYEQRVLFIQDVLCKEYPKYSGYIKQMAYKKILEYENQK